MAPHRPLLGLARAEELDVVVDLEHFALGLGAAPRLGGALGRRLYADQLDVVVVRRDARAERGAALGQREDGALLVGVVQLGLLSVPFVHSYAPRDRTAVVAAQQ